MTRVLRWLIVLTVSVDAVAIDDVADNFALESWYAVEIVLFKQTWISSNERPETLVHEAPSHLPRDVLVLELTENERDQRFKTSIDSNMDPDSEAWFFEEPHVDAQYVNPVEHQNVDEAAGEDRQNVMSNEADCESRLDDCVPNEFVTDPRYPDWLPPDNVTPETTIEAAFKGLFLSSWLVHHSLNELHPQESEESDLNVDEATRDTDTDESFIDLEQQRQELIVSKYSEFKRSLEDSKFAKHEDDFFLENSVSKLQNAPYQLVYHTKWHQRVPGRNSNQTVFLYGGHTYPNGMHEFEGVVSVTRGTYLHLAVDIWHYQPDVETEASYRVPVMELREDRRTRADKVHFFDHPSFGMLVYITRLALPDDLLELLAQ